MLYSLPVLITDLLQYVIRFSKLSSAPSNELLVSEFRLENIGRHEGDPLAALVRNVD